MYKWHTLETLIEYHDYLLLFSIRNINQPAKIYLDNYSSIAGWATPGTVDTLEGLLDQGVTRQRTMGHIRQNNIMDGGTNSLRFGSFMPRLVRQYNKLPDELKVIGIDYEGSKRQLQHYCMEQKLVDSRDWPNYDEMNGRILPSDRILAETRDRIVKKENCLFIEPIPMDDPAHPGYADYQAQMERQREEIWRQHEMAAQRTDNRDLDRG